MIPGRQADPGRELAAGSEQLRHWGLHRQQHRADRAHVRGLGKVLAALVDPTPGHELGIDLVDLRLQLLAVLGLSSKQLPSQGGQAFIGLDALEQRNQGNCSPRVGDGLFG